MQLDLALKIKIYKLIFHLRYLQYVLNRFSHEKAQIR